MKYYFKFIAASLLLLGFFIIAQADSDHDRAKLLSEAGDILPLELILKKANELYSGKILEVELEAEDGVLIYEIELILNNGEIIKLTYDAKTAQSLLTEIKD